MGVFWVDYFFFPFGSPKAMRLLLVNLLFSFGSSPMVDTAEMSLPGEIE